MRHRYYFLLCLLLVFIDQITKLLVIKYFELGEFLFVNVFFNLAYVHNHGAAFGFLADAGGWQRYMLLSVSLLASIVMVIWMLTMHKNETLKLSAITLLLSGALGNLLDRIWYGYVIDFIDIHYQTYHWPIFNIADMLITMGVVLLLFQGRQHA